MSSAQSASDSGVFERKTYDGEEYLVAPVTAIREGVYLYPRTNGRGIKREYLPADEIEETADEWEGEPLTLGHPETPEGEPGLISDPNTTHTNVGMYRDVVVNGDKLGGRVWIRVSEIGEHGGDLKSIVNRANAGIPVDVSTGYFANTDFERGTYDGSRYTHVQKDLEPDHLALLPHNEGNCSTDDGCGVGKRPNMRRASPGARVNHRTILNVRSSARVPEYDGVEETDWSSVDKTLTAFADALGIDYEGETATVDELTREERSKVAELTLLGSVDAETSRELMMFPVVNPETGSLNRNALTAVLGGRGQSADIPQSAFDSAANTAERLLSNEFEDEEDRENADIVTATFEAEGEFDPDILDSVVRKLDSLDGVAAHRSPGSSDPMLHVVVTPVKADEIINYEAAFRRAFEDSPFEVGDAFENRLADLPHGAEMRGVQNVGRPPGTSIHYGNEGTSVSDAVVGEVRRLRAKVNRLIGDSAEEPTGDADDDDVKTNAENSDTQNMENREKLINEITENSDIKADSLEGMGDTCLEATHDEIVNSSEWGDDDGTEDVMNEKVEELESELEETRSTVNELQEQLEAEKREREERLDERLNEETDLSDEAIDDMGIEAKKSVLNELESSEPESDESRYNFAGIPDDSEPDTGSIDVPVAGRSNRENSGD